MGHNAGTDHGSLSLTLASPPPASDPVHGDALRRLPAQLQPLIRRLPHPPDDPQTVRVHQHVLAVQTGRHGWRYRRGRVLCRARSSQQSAAVEARQQAELVHVAPAQCQHYETPTLCVTTTQSPPDRLSMRTTAATTHTGVPHDTGPACCRMDPHDTVATSHHGAMMQNLAHESTTHTSRNSCAAAAAQLTRVQ